MREKEKRVVSIFKVLGSPTRFKIIKLLQKDEMCTSKIAENLGKDRSTISRHLKNLMNLDIIRYVTRDKSVFYRLKKDSVLNLIKYAEKIFGRE
ncbi:winged helix-turn-helix transcriptional regulator [Candidatus Dependentiae bacterium]|nr:winged helix-turn-helix transcriptional regulator [Candidatus Dependentiae bacterium]